MELNRSSKVSVLMSVYSEPLEWIQQAIDSILNQTFSDFEFIIINDNPDRSELDGLLKANQDKDSRLKIHTNPENIGLTKSLNIGLRLCTGKYVARMDADDFSLPDRLAKQVKFMDDNLDIIASSALAFFWDGKKHWGTVARPITHDYFEEYIFTSSPFIHPLLFLRREKLVSYNIEYDESYRVSQDYELASRLIKLGKLANIDERLLYYRISATQISKSKGKEQREAGKRIRRDLINSFYIEHNLNLLPKRINFKTVLDNYTAVRYNNVKGDKHYQSIMNHIRRILYYSLTDYSLSSFTRFVLSLDYLRRPYNLRRFIIILCKHLNIKNVPSLV